MVKESVVTDYMDYCFICGAPKEHTHHLIEGVANRQKSDKYKLIVPVCGNCHNMSKDSIHGNTKMDAMSKIIGQLAFEREEVANGLTKEQAREKFRKEFGKSYL